MQGLIHSPAAGPFQQSRVGLMRLHGRQCASIREVKGVPTLPKRRHVRAPPVNSTGADTILSELMKPEVAACFSAVIAVSSAGINLYGGLLTESKRVDLQKEVEREKTYLQQQSEMQSLVAKYRGPLLEASIDLEQRIHHMVTMTGEWYLSDGKLCREEVKYTLFTFAQFLGFLEVVRREMPRERPFLQVGNIYGSHTLSTLMEGFRFVMCASTQTLLTWQLQGDTRDHPGSRPRKPATSAVALTPSDPQVCPMRVGRGVQRGIGSLMIATPMGAPRHYTISYHDFYARLHNDREIYSWFAPLERELSSLLTGPLWAGQGPFPLNRWTRMLLLQQLLMDTIDLLDPDCVRVPANRRIRLRPAVFAPLPDVEEYKNRLSAMSKALDPIHRPHTFEALDNLMALPAAQLRGLPLQLPGADAGPGPGPWSGPGADPGPRPLNPQAVDPYLDEKISTAAFAKPPARPGAGPGAWHAPEHGISAPDLGPGPRVSSGAGAWEGAAQGTGWQETDVLTEGGVEMLSGVQGSNGWEGASGTASGSGGSAGRANTSNGSRSGAGQSGPHGIAVQQQR